MFSIAYASVRLVPEPLQLRPDIVNSASRGRIRERKPFCYSKVR
jgi:hypothetical protein